MSSTNRIKAVKVILDSNALFVPIEFKIDIFDEVKRLLKRNVDFVLLSPIRKELELLASKKSPEIRKKAEYALNLAKKCNYIEIKNCENLQTDDVIVKVSREWNSPVFTNDRLLRKRLRDISVPVIYLRQKSRLEIDGMI